MSQLPFLRMHSFRAWDEFLKFQDEPMAPNWFVLPGPAIGALAPHMATTVQLALRPTSWVLGFASYCDQAEGFQLQAVDVGTNTPFFSKAVSYPNLSQAAPYAGISFPVVKLSTPRLVLEPGQLSFEITNLSPNANAIEIIVFIAEPLQ